MTPPPNQNASPAIANKSQASPRSKDLAVDLIEAFIIENRDWLVAYTSIRSWVLPKLLVNRKLGVPRQPRCGEFDVPSGCGQLRVPAAIAIVTQPDWLPVRRSGKWRRNTESEGQLPADW